MKAFIKKISLALLSLGVLLILLVVSFAGVLFFNPTLLINPKTINFALKKTHVLKSWSWNKGEVEHHWISWNHRKFRGSFQNFCLSYQKPGVALESCMEDVEWNLDLRWTLKAGFEYGVNQPLIINSNKSKITLGENEKNNVDEKSEQPDFVKYWGLLWKRIVPDMNFKFKSIEIIQPKKATTIDVELLKIKNGLTIKSMGYELIGSEKKIAINAPKKVLIPMDLKTKNPLFFDELKLVALIEDKVISMNMNAEVESAKLKINSGINRNFLKKKHSTPELLKHILLATDGTLEINKLVATLGRLIRAPYNILPTPLNSMEGSFKIHVLAADENNNVLIKITSSLDLTGVKQALVLDLQTDFPLDLVKYSPGPISASLDFKRVSLLLPKFSKNKLPPQLKPDSRFKNTSIEVEDKTPGKRKKRKVSTHKEIEYKMDVEALGEKALSIRTNLLDEILRLNFKLHIEDKTITNGFIQTYPLKTTVFKRPISISSIRLIFNAPKEPEIVATIEFNLPDYAITLKLDGPLSKPRQVFSSQPPMPTDDIFAVLLFGRPLSGLNPDDKLAAAGASQIISQGILSLAVLYYFAGSPIESLGYNPDSKAISAQFGLGAKNSLQVSSDKGGLGTVGVRHSLGKGWYIESSVQKSSSGNTSGGGDYGVLLERIKSY